MGLKATVTTLDDVDEANRGLYKENKDAKTGNVVYCLDIEGSHDLYHPWIKSLKDDAASRRTANTKLEGELAQLRPLAALGDLAAIQDKLARFDELEAAAAGKLDEKKINDIVESRLKTKLAPLERDRDQWKTKAGELEKANGELTAKDKNRIIRDALSTASKDLKVLDTAREDVLMYAGLFEITEEGAVVTKEGNGVTPGLPAKSWLEDMLTKRTHWTGPTIGGGAGGSRGGGMTGANPWAADSWNMTEQGNILRTKGREHADKLAKAAGTTVGGKRPEPAKK